MNELHLIDNFYLRVADKYNFVIIEKTKVKSGKNEGNYVEKNRGYFGTLQSALKYVLNIAIKGDSKALTVQTILDKIETLEELIDGLEYKHISKLFERELK